MLDAVQAKMQMMEATMNDMAMKIDAYVLRVNGMMTTIEDNDKNVKGTIETKLTEIQAATHEEITDEAGISNAQLQAHQQEVKELLNVPYP